MPIFPSYLLLVSSLLILITLRPRLAFLLVLTTFSLLTLLAPSTLLAPLISFILSLALMPLLFSFFFLRILVFLWMAICLVRK